MTLEELKTLLKSAPETKRNYTRWLLSEESIQIVPGVMLIPVESKRQDSSWLIVFKIENVSEAEPNYYSLMGSYDSFNGVDFFEPIDGISEVVPVEVTVKAWHKK